jgi:hypothetical protein
VVEADITTVPAFTVRSSRVLSQITGAGVVTGESFEPSRDNTKFLMPLTNAPAGTESRVVVIENWAAGRR